MGIIKVLHFFAPGNSNKTVRRNESTLFIGSTLGQGDGFGHSSKQLGAQFVKKHRSSVQVSATNNKLNFTTNIDPDSLETSSMSSQISNSLKLGLELQHSLVWTNRTSDQNGFPSTHSQHNWVRENTDMQMVHSPTCGAINRRTKIPTSSPLCTPMR